MSADRRTQPRNSASNGSVPAPQGSALIITFQKEVFKKKKKALFILWFLSKLLPSCWICPLVGKQSIQINTKYWEIPSSGKENGLYKLY